MSNTQAITVDPRQQRGLRIADRMRIEQRRNGQWMVPSESADKKYTVDMANGGWCSCPDHDERGVKCKHIWAVEFTVKRETNEQGELSLIHI